jgi:hypothetical protein
MSCMCECGIADMSVMHDVHAFVRVRGHRGRCVFVGIGGGWCVFVGIGGGW